MKKSFIFLALVILFTGHIAPAQKPSPVYFTRDISGQGVLKGYQRIKDSVKGKVAVKVHFGEEGNKNYLKPELSKSLVELLKATYVETNVLYSGPRQKTESHLKLAHDHGFGFAPIDILDSEGEKVYTCSTACYTRVLTGSHMDRYNTFIILSHFKGHGLAGFGGAMHADYVPDYDTSKCIRCGTCVKQCPAGAISINPLKIDTRKCIGCGQCLKDCPVQAFEASRDRVSSELFNRRLVEYAKVLSDSNHMVYINVLASISPDCDCARNARKPFTGDIGILASTDIVAIEQASLDLVNQAHKCTDAFLKESGRSGNLQIEYAEQLGLGSRKYKLINLD